jgi:hypothetical protein
MKAANRIDACNVCSGSLTLEEARAKPSSVTCSEHFLALLDSDAPQRSTDHRQYGKERG